MELLAVMAAAYLGSGLLRLPTGAVLLCEGRRRWRRVWGRGDWAGLPLRPSAAVLLAAPVGRDAPDACAHESIESPAALRRWDRARSGTHTLAIWCDAYALAWWLGVPALILARGEEAGLLLALGPLAAGHLGTSVVLLLARRRLLREGDPFPASDLAAAVLFPPSLLRARQALLRRIPGAVDPVAASVRLQTREEGRLTLAAALAREDLKPSGPRSAIRARALRALARASRFTDAELGAPPAERAPDAMRYCPICLSDHRSGFTRCTRCEVELRPY